MGINIIDLLEARRLIEQNGIKINGKRENNVSKVLTEIDLKNSALIIQKGKNKFVKIIFK